MRLSPLIWLRGILGLCKVGFKVEGISGCGFRLTCFQGFVGFHAATWDAEVFMGLRMGFPTRVHEDNVLF